MYRTDERERHESRKWGRTEGRWTLQERGDRGAIGAAAASGATKRSRCIVGYSVTGISDARYSDSASLFFFLVFFSQFLISLSFSRSSIPFTSNLSLDVNFWYLFPEVILLLIIEKIIYIIALFFYCNITWMKSQKLKIKEKSSFNKN